MEGEDGKANYAKIIGRLMKKNWVVNTDLCKGDDLI